jgi:pSer/pThr/pTyr-binding forkhead associated (FHA) protein
MSSQSSLVYQADDGSKQDLRLDPASKATIGRHPQCNLFVNQPSVSRRHARLAYEHGEWVIEDLKSSNGTFVNNRRIEKQSLSEGDELRCGDFNMTYLIEEHTREVGDVVEAESQLAAPPGPRLVGTLSQPRRPKIDPGVVERPTIGLQQPIDLTQVPENVDNFPAKESVDQSKVYEAELETVREQLATLKETVGTLEDEKKHLNSESLLLTERIDQLETELTDARANPVSVDDIDDELLDQLVEVYEDLDSLTSEIKLKLKLSAALLADLEPVVSVMEELRTEDLPKSISNRIKMVVEESDAQDTMATARSTFIEADRATRATRRMVRLLREILRPHTTK